MKAAVTVDTGNPDVIQIQEVPTPEIKSGWVLIRVMAFGLNRSELFTRRGDSPGVKFPRIQGIECVGIVEKDSSKTYNKGAKGCCYYGRYGPVF